MKSFSWSAKLSKFIHWQNYLCVHTRSLTVSSEFTCSIDINLSYHPSRVLRCYSCIKGYFRPSLVTNGFDTSLICPDKVVIKEIYLWDFGIHPVLNSPTDNKGENKIGANIFLHTVNTISIEDHFNKDCSKDKGVTFWIAFKIYSYFSF